MRRLLFLLLFVCQLGQAQSPWTSRDIAGLFDTLVNQGAIPAITAVEAYGVTAYDFGIGLLEMGRPDDALFWFSNLSRGDQHPEKFLFGKAWVEMELGHFNVAMVTANELKEGYKYPLIQARSHYLLAVIFKKAGSSEYSMAEAESAAQIYMSLGKQGGVNLCNALLHSAQKIVEMDPPLDGTDS